MNKFQILEREQDKIRELDFAGKSVSSEEMFSQYQRRNSFALDRKLKIHRIFQKGFYEADVTDGYLTLPLATATVWKDPLENPLSDVQGIDSVTGGHIHYGSLVSSFYALCWTERDKAYQSDWDNFSHGKEAVRISTTVGKLMDRMMDPYDSCYMHRSWLISVEYNDPVLIQEMKTPSEVIKNMESSGSLLAASAAIVRTNFSNEDEVRLIFDASFSPLIPNLIYLDKNSLIRIPFDWTDFVDNKVFN